MGADRSFTTRLKHALAVLAVVLALLPFVLFGLLRTGVVTPAELSVRIGPLRIATTCWSRKRFCLPHQDANPPPSELFVLIDWPGGDRREDVLMVIPIG